MCVGDSGFSARTEHATLCGVSKQEGSTIWPLQYGVLCFSKTFRWGLQVADT